jgi:hypothetical protein
MYTFIDLLDTSFGLLIFALTAVCQAPGPSGELCEVLSWGSRAVLES